MIRDYTTASADRPNVMSAPYEDPPIDDVIKFFAVTESQTPSAAMIDDLNRVGELAKAQRDPLLLQTSVAYKCLQLANADVCALDDACMAQERHKILKTIDANQVMSTYKTDKFHVLGMREIISDDEDNVAMQTFLDDQRRFAREQWQHLRNRAYDNCADEWRVYHEQLVASEANCHALESRLDQFRTDADYDSHDESVRMAQLNDVLCHASIEKADMNDKIESIVDRQLKSDGVNVSMNGFIDEHIKSLNDECLRRFGQSVDTDIYHKVSYEYDTDTALCELNTGGDLSRLRLIFTDAVDDLRDDIYGSSNHDDCDDYSNAGSVATDQDEVAVDTNSSAYTTSDTWKVAPTVQTDYHVVHAEPQAHFVVNSNNQEIEVLDHAAVDIGTNHPNQPVVNPAGLFTDSPFFVDMLCSRFDGTTTTIMTHPVPVYTDTARNVVRIDMRSTLRFPQCVKARIDAKHLPSCTLVATLRTDQERGLHRLTFKNGELETTKDNLDRLDTVIADAIELWDAYAKQTYRDILFNVKVQAGRPTPDKEKSVGNIKNNNGWDDWKPRNVADADYTPFKAHIFDDGRNNPTDHTRHPFDHSWISMEIVQLIQLFWKYTRQKSRWEIWKVLPYCSRSRTGWPLGQDLTFHLTNHYAKIMTVGAKLSRTFISQRELVSECHGVVNDVQQIWQGIDINNLLNKALTIAQTRHGSVRIPTNMNVVTLRYLTESVLFQFMMLPSGEITSVNRSNPPLLKDIASSKQLLSDWYFGPVLMELEQSLDADLDESPLMWNTNATRRLMRRIPSELQAMFVKLNTVETYLIRICSLFRSLIDPTKDVREFAIFQCLITSTLFQTRIARLGWDREFFAINTVFNAFSGLLATELFKVSNKDKVDTLLQKILKDPGITGASRYQGHWTFTNLPYTYVGGNDDTNKKLLEKVVYEKNKLLEHIWPLKGLLIPQLPNGHTVRTPTEDDHVYFSIDFSFANVLVNWAMQWEVDDSQPLPVPVEMPMSQPQLYEVSTANYNVLPTVSTDLFREVRPYIPDRHIEARMVELAHRICSLIDPSMTSRSASDNNVATAERFPFASNTVYPLEAAAMALQWPETRHTQWATTKNSVLKRSGSSRLLSISSTRNGLMPLMDKFNFIRRAVTKWAYGRPNPKLPAPPSSEPNYPFVWYG